MRKWLQPVYSSDKYCRYHERKYQSYIASCPFNGFYWSTTLREVLTEILSKKVTFVWDCQRDHLSWKHISPEPTTSRPPTPHLRLLVVSNVDWKTFPEKIPPPAWLCLLLARTTPGTNGTRDEESRKNWDKMDSVPFVCFSLLLPILVDC